LMKVRAKQKAKKPNFRRHDCQKKARLGTNWRKPRGLHNKLRQQVAAKGRLVRPGFGSPRAVRGFHPSGFREVLVNNVAELAGAEGCVVRVASAVGMRKRAVIEARAKEMNLRVLNPKAGGE
jgi:large subunit ribosomal protein L32e